MLVADSPVVDSIAGNLIATPKYGATCGADGISLDGIDDYVDVDDWEWGGATTIEVYVKYDSFSWYSRVLDFSNGKDSDNVYLSTYDNFPKIEWSIRQGDVPEFFEAGEWDQFYWTHVVVTVKGNTMNITKNGILAGSETDGGHEPNVITRTNHLIGASNWDGVSRHFHGSIAYIKMWHNAEVRTRPSICPTVVTAD